MKKVRTEEERDALFNKMVSEENAKRLKKARRIAKVSMILSGFFSNVVVKAILFNNVHSSPGYGIDVRDGQDAGADSGRATPVRPLVVRREDGCRQRERDRGGNNAGEEAG